MTPQIDFFSKKSLVDCLDGMEHEEQIDCISGLRFSAFLQTPEVQSLLSLSSTRVRVAPLRMTYYYFLFRRIGEFMGDDSVCATFEATINISSDSGLNDVYSACANTIPEILYGICLKIEAMTRGQQANGLWDILRDGVVSSSRFHWAVKKSMGSKKLFVQWPIQSNHYVAGPLAFGLRCEETVKTLLSVLIHPNVPCYNNCGFLPSACDGIFGVSLDSAFNAYIDADGSVNFEPDTIVYEIKSRYKYLFSKSECHVLSKHYTALYDNPSPANFFRFMMAIQKPGVDFLPPGKHPTERDYLLTSNEKCHMGPKKRKNLTSQHHLLQQCLIHNKDQKSILHVLTDPSITQGQISIKQTVPVDIYINPAHPYFFQVCLQHMVVQDYIAFKESYTRLGHQKNFIVSAFFRQRHFSDPKECYIGDLAKIEAGREIPVALLITPVRIPSTVLAEYLQSATDFWNKCSKETFKCAPWVQYSDYAGKTLTP
ncbi:alkaline exonuclease [Cricetid gammaherpesvirus 2]|uniref:Alkaline exonuclease n=1 Tax=Cricetid gammaherpesvirus 2 TaxID=1605972 RepID=E9M5M1_9GAMA|nr:alkaline exonuclease [Cricetid gammaherpesvirus 2]ADW24379.1 alkaline exonuclease [Cricetid gammaherpesvirus 2]ADW24461.1 alkaline exonuclease [Cricetid gammaherpesvirus 2]